MIQFNLDTADSGPAPAPFSVSVIGIGGSGTNVIDKISLEGMNGADLVSMNCDARSLQSSMAGTKIQLGKSLTQGLGCGGDPELGAEAALATQSEIREMLTGRNMVFLCVGLGGGTGSGAAPVVARMAREAGAFVVVFATLPFAFEGRRRGNQAGLALQDLRKYANALITFENDRMGELVVPKKGVQEAFELADKIIGQSVRAVTSLVTRPGLIQIGMDDLITALRNTDSRCLFGYGQAKGESRAVEALAQALKSPLLDRGQMLAGARNVLVHICGGTTLTLFEIETLMRELGKHVHEDTQILFGAATDARLNEHLSVTVLTSLHKTAPVAEVLLAPVHAITGPSPVVSAPPDAILPVPVPAKAAPAAISTEEAPQLDMAAPVSTLEPSLVSTAHPVVVDEELFPEIPPVDGSEAVAAGESGDAPSLIEVAPTDFAAPVHIVTDESLGEAAPEPVIADDETAPATAALAPEIVEAEWQEEETDGKAEIIAEIPIEPEPETIPERVIRIDRVPPSQPPHRAAGQRPMPVRPIPVATPQAPAPAKRFVLSEIIKPKPSLPAAEPITEYEAEEEENTPPAAPIRHTPVPVSRRAPDYDRVTPIRPIPAGRTITMSTPFTPAKPATSIPSQRPQPTQQQTFDERLQPASSGSRFDRVKPTVEEGEDLDVPTFLRRKR